MENCMISSERASQVNTQMLPSILFSFEVGIWAIITKSDDLFLSPFCIFNSLSFRVRQMLALCQSDPFCVSLANYLLSLKVQVRAFVRN